MICASPDKPDNARGTQMQDPDSLTLRATFWAKSRGLIARRILLGPIVAPSHRLHAAHDAAGFTQLLAEDSSPLHTMEDARERVLELGKIQNLRIAAAALDGLLIPSGSTFSFWRQVGRPTAAKGYAPGRELRNGCLVPSIGGGLCQLSNALSRTATRAGLIIAERHRHSAQVEDLRFDPDTDATLYWNYVDLRFTARQDCLLRVHLDPQNLLVSLAARA